jgi:hypothetical protein
MNSPADRFRVAQALLTFIRYIYCFGLVWRVRLSRLRFLWPFCIVTGKFLDNNFIKPQQFSCEVSPIPYPSVIQSFDAVRSEILIQS